jgi:type I restriction enzyme S subunit
MVATLQRGFDLPIQFRWAGDVPVYGSNGIDGWHNTVMVRGPGVITGRSGTIGFVYYETRDFWPLNTTLYVRDFHGNFPPFVARLLESLQLNRFSASTGVPSLNRNFVHPFPVLVPSNHEQRRIAEILDTIDEAIQKTEALISKLKAMKQGLLHDLLTRGLDKNGKLRDPKIHPEQFKDSPLGRIPKEWGVMHFESIVLSTTLGTTVRGTNVKEECVPLLKMGNLDWGEIVFEKLEYVQKGLIPSSENVTLQFRDLLFNTRNTPELVGKTAVWRAELRNAVHDNNLLRVRFKQGIASPFVCYYMSTGQGKDRVHALSTGTTSVAAIYWNNLRKYLLPIPPENEQERMVSIVDTHDARIRTEEQYRDKLKLQKKGLMHDLLTGKVRVRT